MRIRVTLKVVLYLVLVGAGLCTSLIGFNSALASDWPSWRGPNQDGSSSENRLGLKLVLRR